MPIINFSNPIYVIVALILILLCAFLAQQYKQNTIPCVVLLVCLSILVGHTIELSALNSMADILPFAVSIAVDEIFIFISFLVFLWLDKLQIEATKKVKKEKGTKKASKTDDKVIEKDGLDVLWKKV